METEPWPTSQSTRHGSLPSLAAYDSNSLHRVLFPTSVAPASITCGPHKIMNIQAVGNEIFLSRYFTTGVVGVCQIGRRLTRGPICSSFSLRCLNWSTAMWVLRYMTIGVSSEM